MGWLERFVSESNRIEGILTTTNAEIQAHETILGLERIHVSDLVDFVQVCAPGHRLRNDPSIPGVRVGNHVAPPSGWEIETVLKHILAHQSDPFDAHVRYENLHPFTDGNGRSGRALWLHSMQALGGRNKIMAERIGFLHSFYYQTLSASDDRALTEGEG